MAQVLYPGGFVGGGAVGGEPLPLRLDALQQRPCGMRLAHHADGQSIAFKEQFGISPVLLGQPQAVHRGGVGSDNLSGKAGLVGSRGEQRGHLGDCGVVAAGEVLK